MKRLRCKVCGARFNISKEDRYIAQERLTGFESITKAPKDFECFDCPECGCQNIVSIRIPEKEAETETEKEEEEE